MKIYAVVGTAPGSMGKPLGEAEIITVLHSFVATKRAGAPIMLKDLGELMLSKLDRSGTSVEKVT